MQSRNRNAASLLAGINQLISKLYALPLRFVLFFEGHLSSSIPVFDQARDAFGRYVHSRLSCYLKSRSQRRLQTVVLNTCYLSPGLASLAHFADWTLQRQGFIGDLSKQPNLVYVKADFEYLESFYRRYLPLIRADQRFVLVTGDTDCTLPFQSDQRWAAHRPSQIELLRRIHDDPRVRCWFAQNLDFAWPKHRPLPLGYWEHGGTRLYRSVLARSEPIKLRDKPLKVLCAHRVREGRQWNKRRRVTERALAEWRSCVDYFENIDPASFFDCISAYPFVMCVGGGGLDPSPKAWTALLAGSIPIIERNPTTEAYRDLPVIFVDSWDALLLNQQVLLGWLKQHEARFSDRELRREVLRQLSMGYWLNKVVGSH